MNQISNDSPFPSSREKTASPERILVVDDEAVVRDLLADFLTSAGYQVVMAESAEEALGRFKTNLFDCIISDMVMPGLGGMALLRRIKEKDPAVIFLIMTGYPSIKDAVEAMKLGAYDYITKPIQLEDLQIKVERALYTRNLEKSLKLINKRLRGLMLLIPSLLILAAIATIIWWR